MEQLKPIHIIRASHRVAERFERHLTIHVAGIYVVMPKGRLAHGNLRVLIRGGRESARNLAGKAL